MVTKRHLIIATSIIRMIGFTLLVWDTFFGLIVLLLAEICCISKELE